MTKRGRSVLLGADEVDRLLDPEALDDGLRQALVELAAGRFNAPPRTTSETGDGRLHVMPGYLPGVGLAVKAVSVVMANQARGLPTHQGVVMVFDEHSGQLAALMDGTVVTERRTAAVSAIATDCLARSDASVLTVVGSGAQARSHAIALSRVRSWSEIRVASRNVTRAAEMSRAIPGAKVAESIESGVRGADVICLCTDSPDPVVQRSWIKEGSHLVSVGRGREVDPAILDAARIFIEWPGAATLPPPAGTADLQGRDPEGMVSLGDVLSGLHKGRLNDTQITLFKSTGHAIEDVAAANVVLERARDAGIGRPLGI